MRANKSSPSSNYNFFQIIVFHIIQHQINSHKSCDYNNRMQSRKKVACFGAGFVGLPTSSVLALMNPNVDFVVFDIDKKKIQICQEGKMPIFEPDLLETFIQVHEKNLFLTSNISVALDNTDVIFLALPTPTKNFGINSGKSYDLSFTERAVRNIAEYYNNNPNKIRQNVIIVQKSTVPIGTGKVLNKILLEVSIQLNKNKYVIASNPQFLAEGTAIYDIKNPSRVILGPFDPKSNIEKLSSLYTYVSDKIIFVNSASSQLSKLAANCFLAQRVSSINSIALMCEEYDSDILEVKKCLASDDRIGSKFLNSGPGFGGSCFQKDILALIYLAEQKGLTQVANYWKSVIDLNNNRKNKIVQRVYRLLNQNIRGKVLTILGISFKKGTCDTRESPAIDICKNLLTQGAILNIVDPQATRQNFILQMKYKQAWSDTFNQRLIYYANALEASKKSSAIIILTEWDQFLNLPYSNIYKVMQRPSYIFDTRLILDESEMTKIGYKYVRIGKKSVEEYSL